ncbi:MFS transporter, DHA2 family, multidrug resistance protein [Rhizobiales bacterium GAS113]|nr:MFS transporter, DHA2 family, multidrug resistance protein [Rhizobiales bacterium GAS113]
MDPAAGTSGVINRPMITATVMLATLMQALDTTIANVALPYVQGSLSATSDQINWVLTSYIVAAAIVTPATGWLEARFGRKPLFLIAVIGFVVASMLCGAAVSLGQIVLFRLLQGIFGAPLVPLSQAVLLDAYPREQQGQAMAVFGLGVMLGPILGPTLGGWLTDSYSWRWVFYVNVPFGAFCVVSILLFLGRRADRPTAGTFDWFGFGMLGIGIAALQLFLDRGEQLDWFASREIQIEAALCLFGFYMFTVHMLSARDPFISAALLRNRNFVLGLIMIFIVGAVLLATLALLTPYLESLMNYPVFTAGLVLAPRGIGTMAAMLLVGQLIRHVDARLLIATGFTMTGLSLYLMTGFTPDVSQGTLIRTGLLQGFGIGFVFVPLSTVTFATLDPALRTQGTGLYNLMRNIGSTIGISVMGYLLVRNAAITQAGLVEHISPYRQVVRDHAQQLNLAARTGRAALAQLVTEQAAAVAYIDNFRLMMFVAFLAIPLVTLVQRPRQAHGGPAPAMD